MTVFAWVLVVQGLVPRTLERFPDPDTCERSRAALTALMRPLDRQRLNPTCKEQK